MKMKKLALAEIINDNILRNTSSEIISTMPKQMVPGMDQTKRQSINVLEVPTPKFVDIYMYTYECVYMFKCAYIYRYTYIDLRVGQKRTY